MCKQHLPSIIVVTCIAAFLLPCSIVAVAETAKEPAKVYVPYDKLKPIFQKEDQGVFLPYKQFQELWRAAQGKPSDVSKAPFAYLLSTARFTGTVKDELAALRLELTIDVLSDKWVEIPLGLGQVGVSKARFVEPASRETKPLLRLVDGRYLLSTKGKGRYVLAVDFVCQMKTTPSLNTLKFKIPSSAVTTLELMIPEENLKVDVKPMLAATTSQVDHEKAKATRLQAFLGSANEVSLSWKPKSEAAAELKPVLICEQFQHINVAEALISHETRLQYIIRRGGVDSFTVKVPGNFRVTDVSGANIAKWDIAESSGGQSTQTVVVKLFSAAKDNFTLTIKMERFLQEVQTQIPLVPVVTEGVLRRSGLIGITCSPRRIVSLKDLTNLARVDTGRLPANLRNQPYATAYRFIAADYKANIAIETASPRININQRWMLGVDTDRLQLKGRLNYSVERTGVFEIQMNLPEPWKIESVGPKDVVDDHQLKGSGRERMLNILLRAEKTGSIELQIEATSERDTSESPVDFRLPLADANDVQLYDGQLVLLLPDQLRAEVEELEQFQAIPLNQAQTFAPAGSLSAAMAFEFRAVDRKSPAGVTFKIAEKPPQISAVVHRLVNIQRGSIEQQAIVDYTVRFAPVDTLYLKVAEELADAALQITGNDIKEQPRIDSLPSEEVEQPSEVAEPNWVYYKIVLQSKVIGNYRLNVKTRRSFQAGEVQKATDVKVGPILAAGKLSDQSGYIAIAKADSFAIGEPKFENLIAADPGSSVDLPYQAHRQLASLAFKYNTPGFELSFPVVTQKEAKVFTTIVTGAVIEQVLTRDRVLNTNATFLLKTGKGDRLPIVLPPEASLTAVLLDGEEAPVELGMNKDERIVRLPPSAGQVAKFVLEVSYSLENAKASNLAAPMLDKEIPVQQTLWRLWIPRDYLLLRHSRVFSKLPGPRSSNMLSQMAIGREGAVKFKLTGQGKAFDFVRQGQPGRLSVMILGQEAFAAIVWAVIIAAGAAMLKLNGFVRILIVLSVALVGGLVHLSSPMLVDHVVQVGIFAGILVLLLWLGQWVFLRLPEIRKALGPRKKAIEQAATVPATQGQPQQKNEKDKE